MQQRNKTVAVIGAGVVGVSTMFHLLEAGYDVVLIDRGEVASGTTYGNAACINPSSIIPIALPGVLRKMPSWLLDPEGPLVLRWQYLPHMLPWLTRFLAASRPAEVERQLTALRSLIGSALSDTQAIAHSAGISHMVQAVGHLTVYSTTAAYEGDIGTRAMRERHGIVVTEMDGRALREREPDLADQFRHARYIAETGHLTDPARYTQAVAEYCFANGARFVRTNVTGMVVRDGRVTDVTTAAGAVPADAVVIAAGSWSAPLVRSLGDRVVLDTERGYHIEVTDAPAGPRVPTLWSEAKIFATPLAGRVRVAGTVELAGLHAPPNWQRTDLLAKQVARMYPVLARDDFAKLQAHERRWLGFRPSTPDSLPVIGPAGSVSNVVYAFGHGHVGLTAGAGTGKLVTDLISNETPSIDLSPFSVQRFA